MKSARDGPVCAGKCLNVCEGADEVCLRWAPGGSRTRVASRSCLGGTRCPSGAPGWDKAESRRSPGGTRCVSWRAQVRLGAATRIYSHRRISTLLLRPALRPPALGEVRRRLRNRGACPGVEVGAVLYPCRSQSGPRCAARLRTSMRSKSYSVCTLARCASVSRDHAGGGLSARPRARHSAHSPQRWRLEHHC